MFLLPVTVKAENIKRPFFNTLAFAKERLSEINRIKQIITTGLPISSLIRRILLNMKKALYTLSD